jgi:hypothetical protein
VARRRTPTPDDGGDPILPRELAEYTGSTAAEYSEFWRARRCWMTDHGINPGDWSQVYPVLKASWKAYGIPGAAERARGLRGVDSDTADKARRRLGIADPQP